MGHNITDYHSGADKDCAAVLTGTDSPTFRQHRDPQ
jgi:hypothetical protein